MKKIFLFLSAVLASLALHATVVTQDFDLSGTEKYGTATVSGGTIEDAADWNGAQLWQWTEGALAYDHVVLEVSDHDYPILLQITYSGSPDDIKEQIEMPAANNSVAIEITHDIIKGVAVLNWSENVDVDITITGLYMRGAIGEKKDPVTLWDNGQTFDEWNAWDDRIQLPASLFDDLHAGDILEVNYTPDAQSYHQYKILLDYSTSTALDFLSGIVDEYQQININTTSNPSQMRFPIISETDVTNIKSQGGLSIHGKYLTINSVKLIRHDVLWSGTKTTGNWENAVEVAASKVSDLKVGNIICVRVSAIGTEGGPRVTLADGTWSTLVDGERYFKGGDEAPMVVEFSVTYKMEQQLRGKNLVVRGVNYTMTDIYVKEGAPINKVAAYLNVSDAGMATYVLPFDVSELPDGVEAYELTNNGDATIWATPVDALEADKPVLIVAAEGEYEFVSEEGASDDISSKTGTYTNGALVGTYQTIDPYDLLSAGVYNYVLNNGTDGVAFYQVLDDDVCYVAPYRAFLSCGHNANAGGAGMAPKKSMRIVFHQDTTTSIEDVQNNSVQCTKVLRDGQLFIIRNGVEYTINGQIVK